MKKTKKDFLFVSLQLLLFILFVMPFQLDQSLPQLPKWPAQLAVIIGLIEVVWAYMQLRNFISAWPTPKDNSELVTWGIFAIIRHPIYSGIVLCTSGYAFYKADLYRLLVCLALLTLFYFKSAYEEKRLVERFKVYPRYKANVGRFFPKLPSFRTKPQ
jgi:protein-S-isoprenylcysteine O-methyltransferase Ste14